MLQFVWISSFFIYHVNGCHWTIFLIYIVADHHQLANVITSARPGVPTFNKIAVLERISDTNIVRDNLPISVSFRWPQRAWVLCTLENICIVVRSSARETNTIVNVVPSRIGVTQVSNSILVNVIKFTLVEVLERNVVRGISMCVENCLLFTAYSFSWSPIMESNLVEVSVWRPGTIRHNMFHRVWWVTSNMEIFVAMSTCEGVDTILVCAPAFVWTTWAI